VKRDIDSIIIGERHRKNLGDIKVLAASIADIGLLHPVVIRPDGVLIAGLRRLEACKLLSWSKVPVTEVNLEEIVRGESAENIYRKDFPLSEAVAIGEALEPLEEEAAKKRKREAGIANLPTVSAKKFSALTKKETGETLSKVAAAIGMSKPTYKKAKEIVEAARKKPKKYAPLVEKMDQIGKVAGIHKDLKRMQKAEKKAKQAKAQPCMDGILVGSITEVGTQITDDTVDFVLTDPPYAGGQVSLFSDLSALVARVLKPGGLCLVYSGQMFLPEVIVGLGEHLEYVWTFAIRHSGGNQRIHKFNLNNAWKPVLAYCKPPLEVWWDSFIDLTTGGREKDLHKWQQAETEAAYFIEHLTMPGALVLDPFMGSGTVLAAAKRLGRAYLGIEIDSDVAAKAAKRIGEVK